MPGGGGQRLVGAGVDARPQGRERPGVGRGALAGGRTVVQRLLHQRVHEREAARRARGAHEVRRRRVVERRERGVRGEAGGRGGDLDVELRAEQGGGLEHPSHVGSEGFEAGHDDVGDRSRRLRVRCHRARVEQRLQEEGVPRRARGECADVLLGDVVAGLRYESRDLHHVEPVQVEARERRRGAEPGDGRGAGARP